jgi:hypothetical protein
MLEKRFKKPLLFMFSLIPDKKKKISKTGEFYYILFGVSLYAWGDIRVKCTGY